MVRKTKLKVSTRVLRKKNRRGSFSGAKHCRFCGNDEIAASLDYKNANLLRSFITERGKILASRVSGTCGLHQREVTKQVKAARVMALLPYTAAQF